MINPNKSLHWLALSCLSVVLLPRPVSDAGAAMPSPVIQEIQMVPRLTITGEVGQTNWILYADELAPANWKVLTNVVVTQSPYVVVDGNAPPALQRFYEVAVISAPTNMVWIPPGTFTMGSPTNEQDRLSYEGPQTQVTISKGFWMGKYEVTQREFQSVVGANHSYFTGDLDRPVEMVNWTDATNYCAKLTTQERLAGRLPAVYVYRLPTEAEWEYACRAATTTRFSYGDDPGYTNLTNYAWYGDNGYTTTNPPVGYLYNESNGRYYITHPVGQKLPNPWGLHDMHGNVWEWCLDGMSYPSHPLPGGSVTDPVGPSAFWFTCRGGGWGSEGSSCRSAVRHVSLVVGRGPSVGFRVVLAPGP